MSKGGKWNCLPRRREEVQIDPIDEIGCTRANGVDGRRFAQVQRIREPPSEPPGREGGQLPKSDVGGRFVRTAERFGTPKSDRVMEWRRYRRRRKDVLTNATLFA